MSTAKQAKAKKSPVKRAKPQPVVHAPEFNELESRVTELEQKVEALSNAKPPAQRRHLG